MMYNWNIHIEYGGIPCVHNVLFYVPLCYLLFSMTDLYPGQILSKYLLVSNNANNLDLVTILLFILYFQLFNARLKVSNCQEKENL